MLPAMTTPTGRGGGGLGRVAGGPVAQGGLGEQKCHAGQGAGHVGAVEPGVAVAGPVGEVVQFGVGEGGQAATQGCESSQPGGVV